MDPIDEKTMQEQLTAAIFAAIDLEASFKLYSYRVIPPEVFIDRVKEQVEIAANLLREPQLNEVD